MTQDWLLRNYTFSENNGRKAVVWYPYTHK